MAGNISASYNTPTAAHFVQSWHSRNMSSPNPNNARNFQQVSTAGAGTVQAPRRLTPHATGSLMRSSATPTVTVSGADTAILGTRHCMPGGHAGHGMGSPACCTKGS